MCGVWGMIAGQAVQGIMQYKQIKQETNAKVAMYRQQEQAAEQNAKISELRQDQIADKYANDQRKLDDRMRLMAGQTAAQAGASNMTLTFSSHRTAHTKMTAVNYYRTNVMTNARNYSTNTTTKTKRPDIKPRQKMPKPRGN